MSRTQHRVLHLVRAGLVGTAGVVLLAACAGKDGGSTGDALAADSTTESSDTASADDFCTQAAGLDDRVDAALSELEDGDTVPQAFRQIAEELRAIQAPDTIATAWLSLADGLEQMADAVADLDITDLDSLDALDDIDGQLTDAGNDVDTYLRDECGIDG